MIVPVALLLAAAPAAAGPAGSDVWAIGYAVGIIRHCPGWTMADQRTLHRKGILPKAAFGTPLWREVETGFYAGLTAVEEARARRPDLCAALPTIAAWPRLSPILIPPGSGSNPD
ncbi:MAG: hypothetical protein ABW173_04635 [Sphingomonas sp.]